MKFEYTTVMNFTNALRGMRNPKESWHKNDTVERICSPNYCSAKDCGECDNCKPTGYCGICVSIGKNDMKLAQQLIRAGSEHRKFMRQIFVSVDVTAPLYWWKEFDTYKVGTTANSTSTMHKLTSKPITLDCFEIDDYDGNIEIYKNIETVCEHSYKTKDFAEGTIEDLEAIRKRYLETKDKKTWKELIRWLPESWLQTRTVTMTYENLLAMCSKGQRRFHKLNEWSGVDNDALTYFIKWARTLPYAQELIFIDEVIEDEKKG